MGKKKEIAEWAKKDDFRVKQAARIQVLEVLEVHGKQQLAQIQKRKKEKITHNIFRRMPEQTLYCDDDEAIR